MKPFPGKEHRAFAARTLTGRRFAFQRRRPGRLAPTSGAVHLRLERASRHAEVRSVIAHTLPEKNAFSAVLSKSGFAFEGVAEHGAVGSVWRWVCNDRRHIRESP